MNREKLNPKDSSDVPSLEAFFGLKFEAVLPVCSWTCVHVWELTHECPWWWLEKLQEIRLSLCIVEVKFKGVHMIWKALRFRFWGLNRFPLHVVILSCQKEIHVSPSSSGPILSTVYRLGEACQITNYILSRHLDWNSSWLDRKDHTTAWHCFYKALLDIYFQKAVE